MRPPPSFTGPVAPSDAKLRRAQALALGNGVALKISKELIIQKLAGQATLVRDMLHDSITSKAIDLFRADLPSADNIDRVRLIEAQAGWNFWPHFGHSMRSKSEACRTTPSVSASRGSVLGGHA